VTDDSCRFFQDDPDRRHVDGHCNALLREVSMVWILVIGFVLLWGFIFLAHHGSEAEEAQRRIMDAEE